MVPTACVPVLDGHLALKVERPHRNRLGRAAARVRSPQCRLLSVYDDLELFNGIEMWTMSFWKVGGHAHASCTRRIAPPAPCAPQIPLVSSKSACQIARDCGAAPLGWCGWGKASCRPVPRRLHVAPSHRVGVLPMKGRGWKSLDFAFGAPNPSNRMSEINAFSKHSKALEFEVVFISCMDLMLL